MRFAVYTKTKWRRCFRLFVEQLNLVFSLHVQDEDTQVSLEMRQRDEEEKLFQAFQRKRESNSQKIRKEVNAEWEQEVQKLIRFDGYKYGSWFINAGDVTALR